MDAAGAISAADAPIRLASEKASTSREMARIQALATRDAIFNHFASAPSDTWIARSKIRALKVIRTNPKQMLESLS